MDLEEKEEDNNLLSNVYGEIEEELNKLKYPSNHTDVQQVIELFSQQAVAKLKNDPN